MAFRLRSRRSAPEKPELSRPDDPATFEPVKRLGLFAVQYVTPQLVDSRGEPYMHMYYRAGAVDRPEGNILEVHLRRDVSLRAVGAQAVRQSFGQVAEYIRQQSDQMQPDEIIGLTDPALGRVAQRFGFDVHDINAHDLPQILVQGIDIATGRPGRGHRDYKSADFRPNHVINQTAQVKTSLDLGHLVVLHQDVDGFLEQFKPQDNSHEPLQVA